jgi:hypothetical protein
MLNRSFRLIAPLTAAFLLSTPGHASADWLFAGYLGASHTLSTKLHVRPDSGTAFDSPDVDFIGEAFTSPIYYGYRIGWLKDDSYLGIEAEFTHAKTIGVDTHSADLTHFEQSHGLNFVLGNVTFRSRDFCGGHCVGVARLGGGITIPHVEATYQGASVSSYQFGGPAAQAGIGVEFTARSGLTGIVDARLTFTHVNDALAGATLSAPFTSWHVNAGVGWKFR